MSSLCGLLNLAKPAGATSRDVVNVVQRLVRPAKAGHAGTLDPLATGVLVVAVGPATRLIPFLQEGRKVYRATFQFSVTSDSHDLETAVTPLTSAPRLTHDAIENALPEFTGAIAQVPPVYSAVHVDGQRAYDLARKGQSVELEAKTVDVHRFELIRFDKESQAGDFEIECGSGTYIRSLGRDLASRLNSAAVMTELTRTAVGPFRLEDATTSKRLDTEVIAVALLPPETGLDQLARVELPDSQIIVFRQGQFVSLPDPVSFVNEQPVAIFSETGRFIAVGRYSASDATLRPKIVFPAA